MQDVSANQVSSVSTARRAVAFQLHPGPATLLSSLNITPGSTAVTYKVTSDADPAGHTATYDGQIALDLVPGTTVHMAIFGTDYELVVRGEVSSTIETLAWYRERLYMLGYISTTELDLPDIHIPAPDAAGAQTNFIAFRGQLTVELLEALLSFQADHHIPLDENIPSNSDSIQRTRAALDLEAGS